MAANASGLLVREAAVEQAISGEAESANAASNAEAGAIIASGPMLASRCSVGAQACDASSLTKPEVVYPGLRQGGGGAWRLRRPRT